MTDESRFAPIGRIRTPYDSLEGMPIQPSIADDTPGTVDLDEDYAPALADLDGFSHCILLYQFHEADGYEPSVTPFLDEESRGLFATRAPTRPNPIGLSVVAIESVEGASIAVRGIDVLDGTPLLDVKPFVPDFDVPEAAETGWMAAVDEDDGRRYADDRFV
ncbi:tRNA (N6-threonylcarbamoyladenosine(37)-N6)-methyltransferase TrmO [Halococcoides cellulosivorans]|uniref:tRNA (N6-threonylcarbamoyladenosine(37)-N6)-methyltransferase TrmO n=1 Tax=Halococcoides cellulosivorans TaxID=1679096 RepID=A0A2R4WXN1_9EURY|nr:tRNA (N6-threonylcarbamoyladenosine(37)-N6)-methyltransferase TrmO [Halococcoides cellulosivorans]AWB26298.1 tRNA (N6-threonylcarbamoyladenosine(37)-N6)-methyltransferase TrmO [Halococcoides cellulosivorans]